MFQNVNQARVWMPNHRYAEFLNVGHHLKLWVLIQNAIHSALIDNFHMSQKVV